MASSEVGERFSFALLLLLHFPKMNIGIYFDFLVPIMLLLLCYHQARTWRDKAALWDLERRAANRPHTTTPDSADRGERLLAWGVALGVARGGHRRPFLRVSQGYAG